ncbi:hypothetical protein [Turneriella parva]|uniref:DUF5018 domain-containing protein n=1 Tax=Turneriella parva (strain ATCC BAA-1111 / DSM 21527 / NCTC 11395 / H) TaxID=869212 RepID=I4B2Y0_TURPD|nr:hypothetical protein [Turneriella parva]AFM11637.1 hypothetical protein Turpa_0988 [Turneriella parva DSM 21527]
MPRINTILFICATPLCLLACSSWGKFWVPGEGAKITAYSIPAIGATGIITGTQISVIAPTLTTLSPQVATFTTTGQSVSVAGVPQTSGVTSNDYASPLFYTVTAADGSKKTYTVTLTAPRSYGGSSLRLWLRADSLALGDGADIANWNDESGTANHMGQATLGQRPIYRTNRVNGMPVASFTDAANSTMSGPDTNINDQSNGSLFIVIAVTADTSLRNILTLHGPQGRAFDLTNGPPTSFIQGRNGAGYNFTSALDFGLNNFIAIGSVQVAAISVNEIWNGDEKTSSGLTYATYDTNGSGSNANYVSNGNLEADIAEILYFDAALSQTEQDKVFCYLNTKYNLASTRRVCDS